MAVASISESLETTHIGTEEKNSDLFLKINVFTLLFELCIYTTKLTIAPTHGKRKKNIGYAYHTYANVFFLNFAT